MSEEVKKIAKIITGDPDIFSEGWEELGIEDPGFDKPAFTMAEFGKLMDSNADPKYYVIRLDENIWILAPFVEYIGDLLEDEAFHDGTPYFTLLQTLQEIKHSDVSLVMDPHEWNVQWTNGWKVTEDHLLSMEWLW
jgi:hypothetical protein